MNLLDSPLQIPIVVGNAVVDIERRVVVAPVGSSAGAAEGRADGGHVAVVAGPDEAALGVDGFLD